MVRIISCMQTDLGWNVLRQVALQPVPAKQSAQSVNLHILLEPERQRLNQTVHINAADFAALAEPSEFSIFNMPSAADLSTQRLKSGAHMEPVLVIGAEAGETHFLQVSIRAQLGQLFERMVPFLSQDFECSWRLAGGTPRQMSKEGPIGVNSVEIDGVGDRPTPHVFQLPLMSHQRRSLAWMMMREKSSETCVLGQRHQRPVGGCSIDLHLELRVDEAFFLQGGLLCDVVGSGKTATVLALVCSDTTSTRLPPRLRDSQTCSNFIRATLVLCPANVHSQWLAEVEKFCPTLQTVSLQTIADLHVEQHHRSSFIQSLLSSNLVIAPYEIFSQPGRIPGSSCDDYVHLDELCWHRLILDEFHEVCSVRTSLDPTRNKQLRFALRHLEVQRRWGLSGTPESFLSTTSGAARAASYFRCDVSPQTAPAFMEQFCRQAKIFMDIEIHEHTVEVHLTPEERAMYVEELSRIQLPQDMNWTHIKNSTATIRKLLALCSHFKTSSSSESRLSAEEVCSEMLRKKEAAVSSAENGLFAVCSFGSVHDLCTAVQEILISHGEPLPLSVRGLVAAFCAEIEAVFPAVFHPPLQRLQRIPDFSAICRDAAHSQKTQPFKVISLPALSKLCSVAEACLDSYPEFPRRLDKSRKTIRALVTTWREASEALLNVQRPLDFFKKTWNALTGQMGGDTCPVCLENMGVSSTYFLFCGHVLCATCALNLRKQSCPVCRFDLKDLKTQAVRLKDLHNNRSSTSNISTEGRSHWSSKLRLVMETLQTIYSRDVDAKVIMFTQWDCLRSNISSLLTEISVRHVSLQGNIFDRARTLQVFQRDPSISLLLLSIEDSASGTNLTVASHVFLLHPMLASSQAEASSFEEQAVGRVRRLGQTKPIHIWRFVTVDTVEHTLWGLTCS